MPGNRRALEQRDRLLDLVAIPERTVLFFERHAGRCSASSRASRRECWSSTSASSPCASVSPGMSWTSSRDEPDRLGAEVVANEGVSRAPA